MQMPQVTSLSDQGRIPRGGGLEIHLSREVGIFQESRRREKYIPERIAWGGSKGRDTAWKSQRKGQQVGMAGSVPHFLIINWINGCVSFCMEQWLDLELEKIAGAGPQGS